MAVHGAAQLRRVVLILTRAVKICGLGFISHLWTHVWLLLGGWGGVFGNFGFFLQHAFSKNKTPAVGFTSGLNARRLLKV